VCSGLFWRSMCSHPHAPVCSNSYTSSAYVSPCWNALLCSAWMEWLTSELTPTSRKGPAPGPITNVLSAFASPHAAHTLLMLYTYTSMDRFGRYKLAFTRLRICGNRLPTPPTSATIALLCASPSPGRSRQNGEPAYRVHPCSPTHRVMII
jgi:hypothetical protein